VTGCTDGIGKAYAEQLAARGLNVVLLSRTLSKLTELATELEEQYKVKTLVIVADFTKLDIYDDIKSHLVSLDIAVLVNNVGTSYDHPEYFAQLNQPNFVQDLVTMNCIAAAKMTELVLPKMVDKKCGYIINVGSSSGTFHVPLLSLYSASKAFIDVFSRCLQQEYSSHGITIQCISPFFVVSKLSKMRKSNLLVPSPTALVKSALNTVGVLANTTGYWSHEIQALVMSVVPSYFVKNSLLAARARALRNKVNSAKMQ
ncbi:very-long-chain 3-oxoacyl-CoA reductase, partial [Biomphalaria glabrata]